MHTFFYKKRGFYFIFLLIDVFVRAIFLSFKLERLSGELCAFGYSIWTTEQGQMKTRVSSTPKTCQHNFEC